MSVKQKKTLPAHRDSLPIRYFVYAFHNQQVVKLYNALKWHMRGVPNLRSLPEIKLIKLGLPKSGAISNYVGVSSAGHRKNVCYVYIYEERTCVLKNQLGVKAEPHALVCSIECIDR